MTKEIEKLIKKRDKIQEQINLKLLEFKNSCTHTNIESKRYTIEGSYYDKSEYRLKEICKDCGEVVNDLHKGWGFYA